VRKHNFYEEIDLNKAQITHQEVLHYNSV